MNYNEAIAWVKGERSVIGKESDIIQAYQADALMTIAAYCTITAVDKEWLSEIHGQRQLKA